MTYFYEDVYFEGVFTLYIKTPFTIEGNTIEEAMKKGYSSGYCGKCRPIYDAETNTLSVTNGGVITEYRIVKPEKMECGFIDGAVDEMLVDEEVFLLCLASWRYGLDKKYKNITFENISYGVVLAE